ncbi:MAG: TonB-dependent receptor [Acidobacteria bacterium]|nr:TonB-dependent receptor [Acidobacteriota bacterium]
MTEFRNLVAAIVIVSACAGVSAQIGPAGSLAGDVTDPSGLRLAGVRVTATTQAGRPVAVLTGRDGTYALRPVMPGACDVTFELVGFETRRRKIVVQADAPTILSVELSIASIPATITVTPEPAPLGFDPELPQGTSFGISMFELMPIDGSLEARITLAPGVNANGPGGAITMSGAPSFGNLFLIDGFVINENLRQQARPFLIADALQETRVAASSVAAEFGRFQGGVVNSITKSGTNKLALSFRAGFTNDGWRALTPFGGDRTINRRMPTLETTIGGPIRKDHLWYFGAIKLEKNEQNRILPYTRINYVFGDTQQHYEGKVSWSPSKRRTVRLFYYRVDDRRTRVANGAVMDLASLYNDATPETLYAGSYNATVGSRMLVEARYSNRQMTMTNVGSQETTLAGGGTPIWDRSRSSARFNSPFGCAVCPGSDDERDNQNLVAKVWFTRSTRTRGTHEVTAGIDAFQESRRNNSYQSGSSFRVLATRSSLVGGQIYPVFLSDKTTWIYWTPILKSAAGNDLRTLSGFLADTWRVNRRMTARLGVRYDYDADKDSLGASVVHNYEFSPRVGFTWDVRGDGRWLLNAAVARYVTAINSAIADSASSGGRPATFVYDYLGPAVNAASATVVSTDALKTLFGWFTANGGTSRTPRSAPSIPGLTSRIASSLRPPHADELALGLTRRLGDSGSLRMDGVYRTSGNFYANRRDMSTGRVSDGLGHVYDLLIVTNANQVARTYGAVNALASYRLGSRIQWSTSYTLSWARGNADGETATSIGPDAAAYTDYPEYRDPTWHSPTGWLAIDQRHKLRTWATIDVPAPRLLGRVSATIIQRVDTPRPYSAVGNINPSGYVANPGYVTPPTSVPYYFSGRGAFRTETLNATDVSMTINRTFGTKTKVQLFFRGHCMNVFNHAAVINVSRTVLTRNDNTAYVAFNPFTDQPVRGVNYVLGPDFGRPTTPGDYQPPREFSFTLGFRY